MLIFAREEAGMKTISIDIEDAEYEELTRALMNMGQTLKGFYEDCTRGLLAGRILEDPFYSESNTARLKHSFKQAEEGKVVVKDMCELEVMAEDA